MVRAVNGSLQQTPYVLNAIRMNVAAYPFLHLMIDDFMACVCIRNAFVGLPVVRNNQFCIWSTVQFNKPMQGPPICAFHRLEANLAAPLDHANHNGLIRLIRALTEPSAVCLAAD